MAKAGEREQASTELQGKVTSLNFNPKGSVEGVVIETTEGRAQINFPKEGGFASDAMRVGSTVKLGVEREDEGHPGQAHPVYRLVKARARVEGVVTALNHARHGEVNGVVLDGGTFVHLKPDGAKRHGLKVGERIRVHGETRIGDAVTVLEAEAVERLRAP